MEAMVERTALLCAAAAEAADCDAGVVDADEVEAEAVEFAAVEFVSGSDVRLPDGDAWMERSLPECAGSFAVSASGAASLSGTASETCALRET
jgi:hypothetical protein